MDEKKHEEIRKGAKKILDNFAGALNKVKIEKKGLKEEVGGFRKEGASADKHDADFRKRMFDNFRIKDSDSARESGDSRHAPAKDEDCIIAETKQW